MHLAKYHRRSSLEKFFAYNPFESRIIDCKSFLKLETVYLWKLMLTGELLENDYERHIGNFIFIRHHQHTRRASEVLIMNDYLHSGSACDLGEFWSNLLPFVRHRIL